MKYQYQKLGVIMASKERRKAAGGGNGCRKA